MKKLTALAVAGFSVATLSAQNLVDEPDSQKVQELVEQSEQASPRSDSYVRVSYGYFDFETEMTLAGISAGGFGGAIDGDGELDGYLHGTTLTYGRYVDGGERGTWQIDVTYIGGELDGDVYYPSAAFSSALEGDRMDFEIKFSRMFPMGKNDDGIPSWLWNYYAFFQYVSTDYTETLPGGGANVWASNGSPTRKYDETFYNFGAGLGLGYNLMTLVDLNEGSPFSSLSVVPKVTGGFAVSNYDDDSTSPNIDTDDYVYTYEWSALMNLSYGFGNDNEWAVFGEAGYKQIGSFAGGDDNTYSADLKGAYYRIGLQFDW